MKGEAKSNTTTKGEDEDDEDEDNDDFDDEEDSAKESSNKPKVGNIASLACSMTNLINEKLPSFENKFAETLTF